MSSLSQRNPVLQINFVNASVLLLFGFLSYSCFLFLVEFTVECLLQRLCEELEYSELLDKASELSDPYERMVYVAAFAVSSYGSSYFRAGSKPFNPLLGETYECIREDKGFRFVAEQVSYILI